MARKSTPRCWRCRGRMREVGGRQEDRGIDYALIIDWRCLTCNVNNTTLELTAKIIADDETDIKSVKDKVETPPAYSSLPVDNGYFGIVSDWPALDSWSRYGVDVVVYINGLPLSKESYVALGDGSVRFINGVVISPDDELSIRQVKVGLEGSIKSPVEVVRVIDHGFDKPLGIVRPGVTKEDA